jgi:phosphatidylglycerophosphatase A
MKTFVVWLASGFGLGYSPVAPGTVGCVPGIVIAALLSSLGLGWQIVLCVILAAVAIPICGLAEDEYGRTDDHRIVADEYLTFPICLLGVPWTSHLWMLPVAFVTNRIMDILKIPPAHQAQSLAGGAGIVLDDVISSLYALAINHVAFSLAMQWMG